MKRIKNVGAFVTQIRENLLPVMEGLPKETVREMIAAEFPWPTDPRYNRNSKKVEDAIEMSSFGISRATNPLGIEPRPLSDIASEIIHNWHKPYFGAVPYLEAMLSLDKITDDWGYDSGKSVVLYFLSNASTWRGDTARRIKAELKQLAGVK